MPRLLPRAPPCIPWPAQGMGGGAWLKLKRIRSLGTLRGFWPKTLHGAHGRHVLFFSKEEEGDYERAETSSQKRERKSKSRRVIREFRIPSRRKSVLRYRIQEFCFDYPLISAKNRLEQIVIK